MMLDLQTWQIFREGELKYKTTAVIAGSTAGADFMFDVPTGTFAVGDRIQLVMPPGTPIYICDVTATPPALEKEGHVQVRAKKINVDTSGIRGV